MRTMYDQIQWLTLNWLSNRAISPPLEAGMYSPGNDACLLTDSPRPIAATSGSFHVHYPLTAGRSGRVAVVTVIWTTAPSCQVFKTVLSIPRKTSPRAICSYNLRALPPGWPLNIYLASETLGWRWPSVLLTCFDWGDDDRKHWAEE